MFFKWYDPILEFFWKILISLVSAFYNLIGYLYQIFNVLIRTRIFTSDDYLGILNKVYLVLGIVVLFVLAYNFLLLVIDPDKNKGGKVVEKFLKDLVISLALMSFVPTIFDFAFDFEASIITENSIQKIFASESNPTSSDSLIVGGRQMAMGVFDSFFYQIDPTTGERKYQQKDEDTPAPKNKAGVPKGMALGEVKQQVTENGKFGKFRAYAENIVDDEVNFDWFLALIAGGYFVYIMLNYCFDMAVRVMKLAFFQIVAPIAIACRMIPSKEGVFKNWYSKTLKTYTSSFIRIFILSMTVYIFQILGKNLESSNFWGSDVDMSFGVKGFAYALLILGIVTFIKQVPQLIDELFGLNADIKLGLRDKVKAATPPEKVLAAGALAGGAITGGLRNAKHAVTNVKNAKGFGNKAKAALYGFGSTLAGGIMGGSKAMWYAKDAKSGKDMVQAAEKSAKEVAYKRNSNEAYRAQKGGGLKGLAALGAKPFVDLADRGKDWLSDGEVLFNEEIAKENRMKPYGAAIDSATEKLITRYSKSAGIIIGNAEDQNFKGENAEEQKEMFNYLKKINGGNQFSISSAENYREQIASVKFDDQSILEEIVREELEKNAEELKRIAEETKLTDEEISELKATKKLKKWTDEEYVKATKEKLNAKRNTAVEEKKEKIYAEARKNLDVVRSQKIMQRAHQLEVLDGMLDSIKKTATANIIDGKISEDVIKADDLFDVKQAVSDFVKAYEKEGSRITDNATKETFGKITDNNKAKTIKDIRDAYEHNAKIARGEQIGKEKNSDGKK